MHTKSFLLIDDDECTNYIMDKILRSIHDIGSFEIKSDSEEALHYLEKCREHNQFPDLIFIDLKMPGMGGFDFINEFERRFHSFFPATEIIVLSSSAREKDKKKSLAYKSVREFMDKPLTKEKLRGLS